MVNLIHILFLILKFRSLDLNKYIFDTSATTAIIQCLCIKERLIYRFKIQLVCHSSTILVLGYKLANVLYLKHVGYKLLKIKFELGHYYLGLRKTALQ